MNILRTLENEELAQKKGHPAFRVGDTIKVSYKMKEGTRERVQQIEGLVIERKHSGLRETFTVRKISHGVGVERTFPYQSPRIEKVEVLKQGVVRRAKLFYVRDKIGKQSKIKEMKG